MPKSATLPRRAPILTRLSPGSRSELLSSIAARSGGQELLDSVGIPSPSPMDIQSDLQAGLHAPVLKPNTPLDQILEGGVTLYASGKMDPAGFDPKEPPLFYETFRGWGNSQEAPPGEARLSIRSLEEDAVAVKVWDQRAHAYWWDRTNARSLLRLDIRTPGKKNSTRAYSLELDFRGLGEFVCFHAYSVGWAKTAVNWVPTSKGTLSAFVELRGDFTHTFYFYRTQKEGFDREFRWFHVTML